MFLEKIGHSGSAYSETMILFIMDQIFHCMDLLIYNVHIMMNGKH